MKAQVYISFVFLLITSFAVRAQDGGLEFLLRAEELRKNNRYREAIDEYNKAIQSDPTNPEYVFRKGKAYVVLKDIDNAIECFEKTINLRKDYLGAYVRLARLYVVKNRINDAIAAFDNAFKYDSNPKEKVEYKINIVKLLMRANRFMEAAPHIADGLALDPNNLQLLFFNAHLNNKTGKHDLAVKDMLKATSFITSQDPRDFARYYYELGLAYYKLGKYPESQQALAKANYGPYKAKVFEMTHLYFQQLSTAYFKVYELEESKKMAEQATKIKPDFAPAHEMLVNISKMTVNQSTVIKQQKIAAEAQKDPGEKAQSFFKVAQMELNSGLYNDAVASADACLAIQPLNYNAAFIKAVALHKLNKLNESMNVINEILKNSGLDQDTRAQTYFLQGLVFNKMKNIKAANEAFKKAEQHPIFKYAAVYELRRNDDETVREKEDEGDTNISTPEDQ
ncbi:MAG: tetratricopeptide repeat protein [Cytophagales bacterium]|nr:tetratricopeptide repeat protein [Bernardetiaceae bacterium]MDW8209830.1 tetratricopeptide repeat protein [Cytophagales bacterium]